MIRRYAVMLLLMGFASTFVVIAQDLQTRHLKMINGGNVSTITAPSSGGAYNFVLPPSNGTLLIATNPALGTAGVMYSVTGAQDTATPGRWLFNVQYNPTPTLGGATAAAGGRILSNAFLDANATGLTISAQAGGTSTAKGLVASATGGATNYAIEINGGSLKINSLDGLLFGTSGVVSAVTIIPSTVTIPAGQVTGISQYALAVGGATGLTSLATGNSGDILVSGGAGANPSFTNPATALGSSVVLYNQTGAQTTAAANGTAYLFNTSYLGAGNTGAGLGGVITSTPTGASNANATGLTINAVPTGTGVAQGIVVNTAAGADLVINEDAITRAGNIAINTGANNALSSNAASFNLGLGTQTTAGSIVLNDATTGTNNTGTIVTPTNFTASRTFTLPDVSGTFLTDGNGWATTGNGHTVTDNTNNLLGTTTAAPLRIVTGSGGPNTRILISATGDVTMNGTAGTPNVTVSNLGGTAKSSMPSGYDRIVLANNTGMLDEASLSVVIGSSAVLYGSASAQNTATPVTANLFNVSYASGSGNAAGATINSSTTAGTANGLTVTAGGTTTNTGITVNATTGSTNQGIVVNTGAGADLVINEDAITRAGNFAINTGVNNTLSSNAASFNLGLGTQTTAGSIVLNDATTGTNNTGTIVTPTNFTANRTFTLPDVSGTFLTDGNGWATTGNGHTVTDGTNNLIGTTTAAAIRVITNSSTRLTVASNGDFTFAGTGGTSNVTMTSLSGATFGSALGANEGIVVGDATGLLSKRSVANVISGSAVLYNQTSAQNTATANGTAYLFNTSYLGAGNTGAGLGGVITSTPTGAANANATGLTINAVPTGSGVAAGIVVNTAAGADLTINEDAITRAGNFAINTGVNNTLSSNAASFNLGLGTQTTAGSIVLNDATTGTNNTGTIVTPTNFTANRTFTLPDVSGTFLTDGNGWATTGNGHTVTDGTNNLIGTTTAAPIRLVTGVGGTTRLTISAAGAFTFAGTAGTSNVTMTSLSGATFGSALGANEGIVVGDATGLLSKRSVANVIGGAAVLYNQTSAQNTATANGTAYLFNLSYLGAANSGAGLGGVITSTPTGAANANATGLTINAVPTGSGVAAGIVVNTAAGADLTINEDAITRAGNFAINTGVNNTLSSDAASFNLGLGTQTTAGSIVLNDATTGTNNTGTIVTPTNFTANRTFTLPDVSGTLLTDGNGWATTGNGHTVTDGTNNLIGPTTAAPLHLITGGSAAANRRVTITAAGDMNINYATNIGNGDATDVATVNTGGAADLVIAETGISRTSADIAINPTAGNAVTTNGKVVLTPPSSGAISGAVGGAITVSAAFIDQSVTPVNNTGATKNITLPAGTNGQILYLRLSVTNTAGTAAIALVNSDASTIETYAQGADYERVLHMIYKTSGTAKWVVLSNVAP